MIILWIILFSILGSIGAIITAAAFLLFKKKIQDVLIPCLIAYATGTLLAAALLGLIPHALEHVSPLPVLSTLLAGILLFFLLEKLVIWRHCHNAKCDVHKSAGSMILIGDAFHNIVDGVIIAATFLISVPVGIVAGLSIIAHEIPQEVGDFAAIVAYFALETVHDIIPYIMAISAASFLYISLVDLSPELHRKIGISHAIRQFLLLLAGVGTIILVLQFHP